jgi:hypothetical protein
MLYNHMIMRSNNIDSLCNAGSALAPTPLKDSHCSSYSLSAAGQQSQAVLKDHYISSTSKRIVPETADILLKPVFTKLALTHEAGARGLLIQLSIVRFPTNA